MAKIIRRAGQMASAITASVRCQGMHDRVLLELPGVKIRLERCTSDDTPHEVTLVLPRIEIRKTTKGAAAETTEEFIYNSITVVHAPRHPEEGRPRPSQSMHREEAQQRSGQSMDNARAMLYTLKQRPAPHDSGRPRNSAHGKEADNRVLDRRNASDR